MKSLLRQLFAVTTAAVLLFSAHNAMAIPSFAAQTNQPCSACHVGAFGPQLKPYGRAFKLYGYVAAEDPKNNDWSQRLTTSLWTSFNQTNKDQTPGGVGYGPNSNFSLDQVAAYFGGRITPTWGAIQEVSYDGANRAFFWDAMDARHAWTGEMFGEDYVAGILFSNQLGNTSIWNSTPPNNFPYNTSRIANSPAAGTLFDDSLNGQIFGSGLYLSWNDLLYAETTVYAPLSHNLDQAVGNPQSDTYVSPIPFWHLAVEHEFDHHQQYVQFGTYGAYAERQPGGDQTTGLRDRVADYGFEANYQYMADMHNMWSLHGNFIHEKQYLDASNALSQSDNPTDYLNTLKADVTYTIDDTIVPTVGYFRTTGSRDATLYQNQTGDPNNNGSPASEGFTMDLAYVPFGKPDSSFNWGNMRLALEYTAYTRFNGTSKNASDNNVLFANMVIALAPLVPALQHNAGAAQ
ncbi:MAG: hypothetical protein JO126_01910 [Alphaproteobacteria bacterium]|nr:hypothetical protein [Alphaproteobacteria bacterium]MBV8548193.1 hypothetical protein [Alphaproteobacteria bacterium]